MKIEVFADADAVAKAAAKIIAARGGGGARTLCHGCQRGEDALANAPGLGR